MTFGVRLLTAAVTCGVAALLASTWALAQEPAEERRPKAEVSAGTWISVGTTTWAHNASSVSGLGNPTSKLTYKDVGTTVAEGAVKFWFNPRVFGRVNFGYGDIGGGRLTDDDYGTGQQLFSRTYSNLPGDNMYYLNFDLGARVKEFANHRGWFDVFGGYQYWHTKYTATGVTQVVCNPGAIPGLTCSVPGSVSNQGQTVITNTTDWHSIRVGGTVEYFLTRRLAVHATGAFIPISVLNNRDVHHLRGDLQQNPSFCMTGYGIGANADVGVRFMFNRHVAMDAGYRVYYNRVIDGDFKTYPVSGASQTFPLTQFDSLRHGVTFGLSVLF